MANQQPDYRAYVVLDRGEGQDPYWLAIGAAWMNQDGEGYSLLLQALPIPGADGHCRVVLRRPKGDEQTTETGPRVVAGTDQERHGPKRR